MLSIKPPYATGLEDLSKVQLIGLVKALQETNAHLAAENRRLKDKVGLFEQRVEALERCLALNSRNSSKPPSGDGPSKPNAQGKKKGQRGTNFRTKLTEGSDNTYVSLRRGIQSDRECQPPKGRWSETNCGI